MHETVMMVIGIMAIIGIYIAYVLFCGKLYYTLKLVPKDKQIFPAWFSWLILIPVVGYIFSWLMLPFGVPGAFKNYRPENKAVVKNSNALFGIGLAYVILPIFAWIPVVGILLMLANLVLFIIYWVKVSKYKWLLKQESDETD